MYIIFLEEGNPLCGCISHQLPTMDPAANVVSSQDQIWEHGTVIVSNYYVCSAIKHTVPSITFRMLCTL